MKRSAFPFRNVFLAFVPRGRLTGFLLLCLLASGFLRFGDYEFAFAKNNSHPATPEDTDPNTDATCEDTRAPTAVLEAIRRQRADLEARELRLADRIQALKVAELQLSENTRVLIEAEKRLAQTLTIADKAAEEDLARLTTVYENMKPKQAAKLFSEMAPEFAAGFLARMEAAPAALLMANLDPAHAYTISLILAGRNARAPRDPS